MIYLIFYRIVIGFDSRWEIYGSWNIYLFMWWYIEKMVLGSLCVFYCWMWDYDVIFVVFLLYG